MRYEEPIMDVVYLDGIDVITLSGGDEVLDVDNNPDEKLPGGWI